MRTHFWLSLLSSTLDIVPNCLKYFGSLAREQCSKDHHKADLFSTFGELVLNIDLKVITALYILR